MASEALRTLLPVAVIVTVVAVRIRMMRRERPLRPALLWILPALLVVLGGFAILAHPPRPAMAALFVGAAMLGGAIGWQRGRLTHIWRHPKSGQLLQKASPEALYLLLGVIAARFAIRYFAGVPMTGGGQDETAIMVTDGLLSFVVGLVVTSRIEMARRARKIAQGEGTAR